MENFLHFSPQKFFHIEQFPSGIVSYEGVEKYHLVLFKVF